jgi:alkanesulfonate monooxygenase SsuD/methylene tetrahydromethanopterin reductase-like flavin-dependent oxidoreductase (luciferase family)
VRPDTCGRALPAKQPAEQPAEQSAEQPAAQPAERPAAQPAEPPATPPEPVRVGIFLLAARFPGQSDGAVLDRTVATAVAAEEAGFDDVWLAEHHFMSYGVCPQATTLAAYVLGATRTIHVGTAVTVLSTRHPVETAEQAAVLDQVSGGRFWLGVGRGGPWVDLEVFGTGLERYESGFADSLDLLLDWLRRERVAGRSERFGFREVPVVPRPRTRPHPPVVVACTSPATERLAAARGLPMLLGMHVDDAEKAAAVDRYAAAVSGSDRYAGGPARGAHIAAAVAYVADSRAEAVRTLRTAMPRWLGPGLAGYVPVDGRPRPRRDPYDYARRLCDLHPVGSPAYCVDSLTATAERTGVRHFILMVEGAGDHHRTVENVARLGAEVLPGLRGGQGGRRTRAKNPSPPAPAPPDRDRSQQSRSSGD